jgi:hypothetical protein
MVIDMRVVNGQILLIAKDIDLDARSKEGRSDRGDNLYVVNGSDDAQQMDI